MGEMQSYREDKSQRHKSEKWQSKVRPKDGNDDEDD
jgi:hypothetical protein